MLSLFLKLSIFSFANLKELVEASYTINSKIMTGMFPYLGYLIFLLIIASVILPIISLVIINLKLHKNKEKIMNRIFYNLIFLVSFFIIQKEINESRTKYLLHILEIENILTFILSFTLLFQLKKSSK
uniref:hypothetical protein n=1 Tax=Chryseobacterium sp. TaxID=1871047 RepID=UPI00289F3FA6